MQYLNEIEQWLSTHKSSTLPNWLNRNPTIKQWVIDSTNNYTVKNIMERVYILQNGSQPFCKYNNPLQFNTYELGYRKGCILGNKCRCVAELRQTNQVATLLKKYGVSSTGQIPGSLEKRQQTMLSRFGVKYAAQAESVKSKLKNTWDNKSPEQLQAIVEKTKQTNIKKYGVEHHMKLQSQQQKVFATNLERYDAKVPMQNSTIAAQAKETYKKNDKCEIIRKTKNTIYNKYGVSAASRINIPLDVLEILDDRNKFETTIANKTRKEIIQQLNIAEHTLYLYAKKYNVQHLFKIDNSSEPERQISEFIISLGFNIEIGNRTILSGKELDIFIPDLNIAIEHCGLYFHSEMSSGRDKNYHYEKYKQCLDKDITLITIFGDEWQNKRTQVKNRLIHILKKSPLTLYARNCIVKEIDSQTTFNFLNTNHLQGAVSSKIKLGLFFNNQLVSVMTFSKPRYNKKYEYELIRFCSSCNVVGAASKLFKYFIRTYNPLTIISYSDNRWGNGLLYNTLSMTKESETIGFFFTDYTNRFNRTQMQKHKLVENGANPQLTAKAILRERKIDTIWDCGQSMWTWYK
jgi:hypothetical protein